MNPQHITRQWLAFQKQSLENMQSVWQLSQTQSADAVDRLLDQGVWVPEQGREMIENWRTLMKKERERFAAFVDRGFAIYEAMLEPSTRVSTVKTKQPKAE